MSPDKFPQTPLIFAELVGKLYKLKPARGQTLQNTRVGEGRLVSASTQVDYDNDLMQNLAAALKRSRIANIPQIGLRLVNNLQSGHTPSQFWTEYIDFVRNPDNFRRLSPHSKCLLTCVVTKFDRDLVSKTQSGDLLGRIYSDVINRRCISLLNLELLNMLLVSSYTLGIPLTSDQLETLLARIHEEIAGSDGRSGLLDRSNDADPGRARLKIEDAVSIVHSLASLCRRFPQHLKAVRDSSAVKRFEGDLDRLLPMLNGREFSLVLFAFDKLRLLRADNAHKFYTFARKMIERFDSQALTTVLYIASSHPRLKSLFDLVKAKSGGAVEAAESAPENPPSTLTGRESCNMICSFIRCNEFNEGHYALLVQKIPEMNLQEVCNACSLLVSKRYPVGGDLKRAFVDKLMGSDLADAVMLDALTVAHCFHAWGIRNELVLDRLVAAISSNGNFAFGEKSILFLHYLVRLNAANLDRLLPLYSRHFRPEAATASQLIVLFNALATLRTLTTHSGAEFDEATDSAAREITGTIEAELIRVDFKTLSRIDLFTLARSQNVEILQKLICHVFEHGVPSKLEVCSNILKGTCDPAIARQIGFRVNELDLERLFNAKRHDRGNGPGELTHLFSIIMALKDLELLKRAVDVAESGAGGPDAVLAALNCCKKLHHVDPKVHSLMRVAAAAFTGALWPLHHRGGAGSRVSYAQKLALADFFSALYQLDHRNTLPTFDAGLTKAIAGLSLGDIYSLGGPSPGGADAAPTAKGADTPGTLLSDLQLFESAMFSVSNLCFNAVVDFVALARLIRHYLGHATAPSALALKCLAMNPGCVHMLDLRLLQRLNTPAFDLYFGGVEHNEVQSSVFATLRKLGLSVAAEHQVFDYRLDLLIG